MSFLHLLAENHQHSNFLMNTSLAGLALLSGALENASNGPSLVSLHVRAKVLYVMILRIGAKVFTLMKVQYS